MPPPTPSTAVSLRKNTYFVLPRTVHHDSLLNVYVKLRIIPDNA